MGLDKRKLIVQIMDKMKVRKEMEVERPKSWKIMAFQDESFQDNQFPLILKVELVL